MSKPKINPVYELEKQAIKDRLLVYKVLEDGKLETSEKIMFDFMNNIYNEGVKGVNNNKKKLCIIVGILCFMAGVVLGFLVMSMLVAK